MLDTTLLPLSTETIRLRAMHSADAKAYAAGTEDEAVRTFGHLPEPEYSEASVLSLIDGPISEGIARGDLAVLTIADAATDEFSGSLVLFGPQSDSIEVGFWIHPDHRGKGISTAALRLALELVRRSGFTRLTARTVPENIPSQRSLARAGFTLEGQARDVAPSGQEATLLTYMRAIEPIRLFPIDTERLRLRLHQHGDAHALQAIYKRPDVARYLLEDPWTPSDADRQVSQRIARTGLGDGSTALSLIIEHDGQVIGDVAIWLTNPDHGIAEIGWVLDPDWGGQGLATEAVHEVLRLAFAELGLHRVSAQMDARNTASARLAERVRLIREAHLRQDWWSKGEWTDTLIFGGLASDFSTPSSP